MDLSNFPSNDSVNPLAESVAVVANPEPSDVDRSAERASSAVEVGAPVSPERATQSEPCLGHATDCSSLAAREADESAAPISPSAAHPVEPEATPSPPPASGNPFPDPHSQRLTTGGLHTSSDDAGAKSNGLHSVVGQGGGEPGIHHSQSEQQDARATQARNEPGSVSGATVTNSKPDCLHPDTCKLHFTSALCWSCNDARMRRAGA